MTTIETVSASKDNKVYKLRMLMSIIYGLLIPVTLLPFLTALLAYNTAELAPTMRDWIVFLASVLSPVIFLIAFIGGIWCARGVRGRTKNIIGRVFLVLPIICILLIALIYA